MVVKFVSHVRFDVSFTINFCVPRRSEVKHKTHICGLDLLNLAQYDWLSLENTQVDATGADLLIAADVIVILVIYTIVQSYCSV